MIVKPQTFTAAVKWAAKFVAGKVNVPIQAGVRIDAEDGRIVLTAFNENASARAVVTAEGGGGWSCVVSGRLLAQVAAALPRRDVELDMDEQVLAMTAGKWRGTLPTMPIQDWPEQMPEAPHAGEMKGDDLAELIRRAGVAVIDERKLEEDATATAALACIHLTFGGNAARALATDRYRAVLCTANYEGRETSALVLGRVLGEAAAAFAGPDRIRIGIEAGITLSFASPTRAVVLRQLGEAYDPDRIVGFFTHTSGFPDTARFDAGALLEAARRAEALSEAKAPIRLHFSKGEVAITAAAADSTKGSAEPIDADYDGPDWTLTMNPTYLAEAVASAPSNTVQIRMSTEQVTGVQFTVPGKTSWAHALMPIRK